MNRHDKLQIELPTPRFSVWCYDKKLDSIMDKVAKSEVKQFKTIQNINNTIIENKVNKVWYSQSDSLRLIFIDSAFRVERL